MRKELQELRKERGGRVALGEEESEGEVMKLRSPQTKVAGGGGDGGGDGDENRGEEGEIFVCRKVEVDQKEGLVSGGVQGRVEACLGVAACDGGRGRSEGL